MQFTIKRTPNTGTVVLSLSLICTLCVFLLVMLALFLVILGLAGELLGPVLVGLGRALLESAGLVFLLILALRLLKRIAQTIYRALLATSFAAQVRPWIVMLLWLARCTLAAGIRWYLKQEKKWGI